MSSPSNSPQAARAFWERMSRERPMDADLERMIDLAWTHRVRHTRTGRTVSSSNADIYSLYNRIFRNWSWAPPQTQSFLDGLATIPHSFEIQCDVRDELGALLGSNWGATTAASGLMTITMFGYRQMLDYLRKNPNDRLLTLLAATFYHFRKTLSVPSVWRVYLRVHDHARIQVMRWVVANLLELPGCINAKIGAPSRDDRADSVVIYLTDEAVGDQALRLLRQYQSNAENRSCFVHGVPRMIRPVQDLQGVGVGAEPPVALFDHGNRLQIYRGNSSFGTYRYQLISMALLYTLHYGQDKQAFMNRVVDYFRRAGIDPANPERHSGIDRLVYVAEKARADAFIWG